MQPLRFVSAGTQTERMTCSARNWTIGAAPSWKIPLRVYATLANCSSTVVTGDCTDPIGLATLQTCCHILSIERCRHCTQQCGIDVLEHVDVHDGIQALVDAAGDE